MGQQESGVKATVRSAVILIELWNRLEGPNGLHLLLILVIL